MRLSRSRPRRARTREALTHCPSRSVADPDMLAQEAGSRWCAVTLGQVDLRGFRRSCAPAARNCHARSHTRCGKSLARPRSRTGSGRTNGTRGRGGAIPDGMETFVTLRDTMRASALRTPGGRARTGGVRRPDGQSSARRPERRLRVPQRQPVPDRGRNAGRIVVLDTGKVSISKVRGLVTELPRSTRLGPALLWHQIPAGTEKLRVYTALALAGVRGARMSCRTAEHHRHSDHCGAGLPLRKGPVSPDLPQA
jgi:hypothetical protein